jgi:hypothetical protein
MAVNCIVRRARPVFLENPLAANPATPIDSQKGDKFGLDKVCVCHTAQPIGSADKHALQGGFTPVDPDKGETCRPFDPPHDRPGRSNC